MSAYYNENDSFAAAWLRELIKANLIAPGEVDERSIEEVKPDDLRGFTQCHFFAGIGVWSYALRAAGWSDDTPVWTGSCPCQSFSASGKGEGFSDKRHLWPAWFRLISERRPDTIFGEQVSQKNGLAWFDVVSADMEGIGYAIGALSTAAAGVGAPHIRQRLYFVADSSCRTSQRNSRGILGTQEEVSAKDRTKHGDLSVGYSDGGPTSIVADSGGRRREQCDEGQRAIQFADTDGEIINPGNSDSERLQGHGRPIEQYGSQGRQEQTRRASTTGNDGQLAQPDGIESQDGELQRGRRLVQPSENPLAGFWSDAEWIYCRDDKWRPVEPGSFPLASGITKRVGKLRGYGNALVAPQAQAFIEAYMDIL